MFGTLFDEETKCDAVAEAPAYSPTAAESNVPTPRPGHLLCGLNNQGTTCYLNSLIQTLFFTSEFRDAIFKLTPEELGLTGGDASNDKIRVILVELQRLFARLLWVDTSTTSTTALTESFGWAGKEAFQQHDVQELMRILYDAIHTSLVGTSCSTLISDLYGGSTVDKITCKSCGNVSEKTGFFLDVNVTVTGYESLKESLTSSFIENETMTGNNQYLCDKCNCHVDAAKETKLRSLPPILVFSLLRLGYNTAKKQRFKEIGRFEFPMEINMNPFCETEKPVEEVEYELFAVLIHSGSSYCGHYNVFIHDMDHVGVWHVPETKCVVTSKRDPPPEVIKKENVAVYKPAELLLRILSKHKPSGMEIGMLQNEIIRQTSSGWNKIYKRRFGALTKFVVSNPQTFIFCEKTRTVKLKDSHVSNGTIPEETKVNGAEEHEDSKANGKPKNKSSADCVMDTSEPVTNMNGIDDQCKYWFDINDSTVTPIFAEDIQHQFGGRSSAYMLFFRRKSLHDKISTDQIANIPNHLEDFVQQENELLMNLRQEYEKSVNQLLLHVHFGDKHYIEKGILHAMPNELSVVEMIVDKRILVTDLHNEILRNFGDVSPNQFAMHRCKALPSGLHLYEDLLKNYGSNTLGEFGLTSGSRVFMWNGETVNGIPLSVGVDSEPVLINIVIEKEDGNTEEAKYAFPVSISVNVLLLSVGEQMEIRAQDLSLSRIISGSSIRVCNNINEESTLRELELWDGDYLHLDIARKRPKVSHRDHSKSDLRLIVKIENRCQELLDPSALYPVIDVQIDKAALVSELKALTLTKLALNANGNYRLRVQTDPLGCNPPLHENQSVQDLGSSLQSSLILEEGIPPNEQQMILTYSGNFGSGDARNEVLVDADVTVRECLQIILRSASVSGGEWFLQRVNNYNELSAVLSKSDATLVSEGVKHGDHLYVCEGHVVPYGYLSFVIELHSSVLDKRNPPSKHWTWVMDKISKCQTNIDNVQVNGNRAMKAILGEVEISAEATLENLKQQILTLPVLDELELYTQPQFIRLRLLNSGRPGRILRGCQITLKKLKLFNHSRLCVQILSAPEELSFDTLVLEVVQKIATTNQYTDPVEILWRTSSGTLSCLRHTIANQLFLTENTLRLAKYLPDEFDWLVLTNDTQFPSNYKSFKRKCKQNLDLRNEPYSIKDGDRIAIQDTNENSSKEFSSEDDIKNRRRLEEAKENKQKQTCLAQERSGPLEVGIKIKVGNFN